MQEFEDEVQRRAVCERQWDGESASDAMGVSADTQHARYPLVLSAMTEHPWAILPTKWHAVVNLMAMRAAGGKYTADEIREIIGAPQQSRAQRSQSIAMIPIMGVMARRVGAIGESSGAVDTGRITQEIRAAAQDRAVSSIILHIDSPGGNVDGIPELAQVVRDARAQKPVVAVADSMAASAAYWVGSQASEFFAAPSGVLGSIGVFTSHDDLSRALDAAGVTRSLISAGKFKTEAHPFAPLGDEARAAIQADVDAYYQMFVKDVARGRNVSVEAVKGGFGEGRTVLAANARREKMIDGIMTLDQVIARQMRGASAEVDIEYHADIVEESQDAPEPASDLGIAASADIDDGKTPRQRKLDRLMHIYGHTK